MDRLQDVQGRAGRLMGDLVADVHGAAAASGGERNNQPASLIVAAGAVNPGESGACLLSQFLAMVWGRWVSSVW